MSWSISFVGKPELLVAALDEHSLRLSGQSQVEFDAAKPHLIELVKNNFAVEGSGYTPNLVRLRASGSGVANGAGDQVKRDCTVVLEPVYEQLLV